MRFVPTRIHGVIDYATGLVLIAMPWLLGFATGGAAQWVPVVLGAGVIVYSMLTNYELGLVRTLPMPIHLVLDAGGGLLLAVSPWLFGFADRTWVAHVAVGLFEIVMSVVTRVTPETQPGQHTVGAMR